MTDAVTDTTPRRSLLRHRDFVLLWGGQSVSEVGSAVTQLAMPLAAVVLLNASTFQVGVLIAVQMLPFLLISLPAGAVVDRVRKHKLMMWCDAGRFVLLGSIPLATVPGLHLTYVHLLVVAFLAGTLTVFFDVAYQSYLPTLLSKEDLIDANGKLSTTQEFALLAGPSVGGGLVGLVGAARAMAADAVSFALSALSLFLIRTPEPKPEPRHPDRRIRDDIKEGLSFVVKHPILRHVVACTGVSNFFGNMLFAVEIPFLVRELHLKPGQVGLLLSLAAVGGIIGGLISGKLARAIGSARMIWFAQLVIAIPTFVMPLAGHGWRVLFWPLGIWFFGMMAVTYNVAQVSYRQSVTPPDMLGRMNASVRFIVWGTIPLGAALGGAFGTWFGLRETIAIGVVGSYLAGFFVFFSPLRHMRDVPTEQEPAGPVADGAPAPVAST